MGGIGLGAIVFYMGIALGAWDLNPLDSQSYWNVVLATIMIILGIVLIITGLVGFGSLILAVVAIYIYNFDNSSILDHFIDPVVFIFVIFIIIGSWMGNDPDSKKRLRRELRDSDLTQARYRSLYGGKDPEPNSSRLYDISHEAYKGNKKKWKKHFDDEEW